MGFTNDNVVLALVLKFLPDAKVYVIADFQLFTVWTGGSDDACFGLVAWRDDKEFVLLNIGFDDEAVLHGIECHFFFGVDLAASRLTEYAMATACLTGLPDFTSAATLALNALGLVDFFSGMINSPSKMM